mmetsp:Transcript_3712/g.15443  ORF Transcript_3712/g.15443 Transcript_3712/m.15443 type:complete len:683 (+) Transcript_3712:1211-3259(+)
MAAASVATATPTRSAAVTPHPVAPSDGDTRRALASSATSGSAAHSTDTTTSPAATLQPSVAAQRRVYSPSPCGANHGAVSPPPTSAGRLPGPPCGPAAAATAAASGPSKHCPTAPAPPSSPAERAGANSPSAKPGAEAASKAARGHLRSTKTHPRKDQLARCRATVDALDSTAASASAATAASADLAAVEALAAAACDASVAVAAWNAAAEAPLPPARASASAVGSAEPPPQRPSIDSAGSAATPAGATRGMAVDRAAASAASAASPAVSDAFAAKATATASARSVSWAEHPLSATAAAAAASALDRSDAPSVAGTDANATDTFRRDSGGSGSSRPHAPPARSDAGRASRSAAVSKARLNRRTLAPTAAAAPDDVPLVWACAPLRDACTRDRTSAGRAAAASDLTNRASEPATRSEVALNSAEPVPYDTRSEALPAEPAAGSTSGRGPGARHSAVTVTLAASLVQPSVADTATTVVPRRVGVSVVASDTEPAPDALPAPVSRADSRGSGPSALAELLILPSATCSGAVSARSRAAWDTGVAVNVTTSPLASAATTSKGTAVKAAAASDPDALTRDVDASGRARTGRSLHRARRATDEELARQPSDTRRRRVQSPTPGRVTAVEPSAGAAITAEPLAIAGASRLAAHIGTGPEDVGAVSLHGTVACAKRPACPAELVGCTDQA